MIDSGERADLERPFTIPGRTAIACMRSSIQRPTFGDLDHGMFGHEGPDDTQNPLAGVVEDDDEADF